MPIPLPLHIPIQAGWLKSFFADGDLSMTRCTLTVPSPLLGDSHALFTGSSAPYLPCHVQKNIPTNLFFLLGPTLSYSGINLPRPSTADQVDGSALWHVFSPRSFDSKNGLTITARLKAAHALHISLLGVVNLVCSFKFIG